MSASKSVRSITGSIHEPSRSRSIAFIGLSVALLTVSAWVSVPLGPVPFTLQTFVLVFILLALPAKHAVAAVGVYLLLGAVGLPVFSSFRGGLGVLGGPTGGFLWGFLVAMIASSSILSAVSRDGATRGKVISIAHVRVPVRNLVLSVVAAILFLLISYACGTVQLMIVGNLSVEAALLAAVAPFVVIDIAKTALAIVMAFSVSSAISLSR